MAAAAGAAVGCTRSKRPVQKFRLVGRVVKLTADRKTALIQHQKIEGWMEAMTMDFPVKSDAEWAKLREGAQITATVCYDAEGVSYWIEDIQVTGGGQ